MLGCKFFQVYGLTETTGAITHLPPSDHDLGGATAHRLRSCGVAGPGVELRIIDVVTGADIVEPEVPGEILVRGQQVMKGYWNNPDATREAIDDDGWFRSGDIGYLDADGYLYIHDRVKDMIVSGGENIYPAEVENVLMSHPAIADVAVIGVPSEKWGESPKAIVVLQPGGGTRRGGHHRLRPRAAGEVQVPDERRLHRRPAAQPERQDPQEGPPRPLLGRPRPPGQLTAPLRSRPVGFRGRLLVITAVGAAWRLGYLIVAKADQPLLLNDSIYFSIQAGLNSEGHWFEDALTGQPGAEHGMLTSLYLTPWSIGGGDSVFPQRLGITLLGIATVFVIGMTGRRLASGFGVATAERIGLLAAAIAAVYPNLWVNDSLVMSETLAILLVSLALYVALGHHVNPTVASGALLGVLAGLGALTRSEIALLIPGFAIVSWLVCRRRRLPAWPAVAIVAVGVATLLPWSIYNLSRFAKPVLLSTNDGNTLLGANCDITYYDDVGGWDIRCLGPLEPGLDASQRSTERRDAAFDYVTDHPGRVPIVVAARAGRLLDVYGLGSLVALDVGEEKARWAVWAGIVAWWLLAVGAVAGWAVLTRARIGARWWLLVPCIAVVLTALLFYGAHRIRAPAEPVIVLLAAVAIGGRAGPFIAFPGHAGRCWPLLGWRLVAHSRRHVDQNGDMM